MPALVALVGVPCCSSRSTPRRRRSRSPCTTARAASAWPSTPGRTPSTSRRCVARLPRRGRRHPGRRHRRRRRHRSRPFTGLRVGHRHGRAFGHALGIPVHGVCSLDALADRRGRAPGGVDDPRRDRRAPQGGLLGAYGRTATARWRSTEPAVTGPPTSPRTSRAADRRARAALYPDLFPRAARRTRSTSTPAGWLAWRPATGGVRRCRSSRSTCAVRTPSPRPSEVGREVMTPALRDARWTDLAELAALESDLFADDAWSAPTWWSELAGRPRRDYVVRRATPTAATVLGYAGLDLGGRGRRRHDHRGRPRAPGPRARAAAARRAGATGRPREARRTCSSRCGPTTPRARPLRRAPASSVIGVRRRYYQPGDVDAHVMRRSMHESGTGDA